MRSFLHCVLLHGEFINVVYYKYKLRTMEQIFLKTMRQSEVDFILNGSENRIPGNINISIREANGEMLLHRLDLKRISISTGSACDSVNTQVSHVIHAIGVPEEYAEGTIRISFGKDNQIEDAHAIATEIISILRKNKISMMSERRTVLFPKGR